MNSPNTEYIQKIVSELEESVPREGARIRLTQYGGGLDECKIVGNQRGYLRLGIEFLNMAVAPLSTQSNDAVVADLSYLLTGDSDVGFDWFERREDLLVKTQAERKPQTLVPVVILLVLLSAFVVFVIGVATVVSWVCQ